MPDGSARLAPDGWSWLAAAVLAFSLCLNGVLLLAPGRHSPPARRPEPSAPGSDTRRLAAEFLPKPAGLPAGPSTGGRMADCASAACPRDFSPSPKIDPGRAAYRPFVADTRFQPHAPHSMLELTRLIYGQAARLGEPFIGYDNPFGRKPDLSYEWTQITEPKLDAALRLLGGRVRLVVEVGSFVGRSSALIGRWLASLDLGPRARADVGHRLRGRGAHEPAPGMLLCIDTWLGDVGMVLGRSTRRPTPSPSAAPSAAAAAAAAPAPAPGPAPLPTPAPAPSQVLLREDGQGPRPPDALPHVGAQHDRRQPDRARAATRRAVAPRRAGARLPAAAFGHRLP